jgi:hypothetical protein
LGSWTLWQRFSNSMSGDCVCVEERAAEEEANGIVNREITLRTSGSKELTESRRSNPNRFGLLCA